VEKNNSVIVPTLVTYKAMATHGKDIGMSQISLEKNIKVLDAGFNAVEIAMKKGISVGFGSDLMGDLESEQLIGLQVQHEVQGTLELLRSITSRNAEILQSNRHGWIREKMTGDLLVLDGNPFEDASTIWTQTQGRVVIKAGTIII
jgi:imidazolonepropionase-like amidohydrolase